LKMNKKTFVLFSFFLFLTCIFLSAQKPVEELLYFEQKYPNSSAVDVVLKQRLDINMVKGKPEIYFEYYSETIILTDMVSGFANEDVHYSPKSPLVSVEAWSLVPDGNKYRKIPVKNFTHKSAVEDLFFSDSRTCNFVYTGLTKGSKVVYKYRKKINDPYLLPRLFLSSPRALEYAEAIIEYDNLIDVQFNYIGFQPGAKNNHSANKGKKKTKVQLVTQSVPGMKSEKYVGSYLPYFMHIIPRIAYYKTSSNGNPVAVLPDLAHLYKYNSSYIDSIAKVDDAKLAALADSITSQLTDEFDKVKAVYDWVQHNIRYVAIEDGDKGLVPEGAAQVFNKRYGDCKGMSNLMKTMLDGIGIQSHITWVGTSRLPYKYTELPSPVVDNHMILHYAGANGKDYILDATSEYQSIEYAPSAIQGKQCLISIDSSTYRVYEIPHSFNLVQQSMVINIDGTSLKITDTTCYNGNYKNAIAYALAHKSNSEKQRFYQNMLDGEGFPKSTVYNLQHTDIYAVDNPLCFYANFELRDYIIEIADELYMKPYFGKTVETSIDIAKRKYPFSLSNKGGWLCTQIINIPKEYSISHLPENIDFTHPLFALKVHYTHNKNQLLIDIDYHENFITLPTEDYEKWNEMNKLVRQVRGQSIVFRKN